MKFALLLYDAICLTDSVTDSPAARWLENKRSSRLKNKHNNNQLERFRSHGKRLPFRTACMTGHARTRSVIKPRGPTRQFSENTRCRECVKYNFRVPKPKSQNIIRNGRQVCKCWQKTSMVHIARASQPFLKNFLHRYISSYLSNLAACWRIFSSSISQLIQSK